MRRPSAALALVTLAGALAACSGGSGQLTPAQKSAAAAVVEASGPAVANGSCNKAGFQQHAGTAAGSVGTYVWSPLQAGAFKDGAKNRAKALRTAASASGLVAKELGAASPLIAGCPGSVILVNAMTTGSSLAKAAQAQFSKGNVNAETVAGMNSIVGTITMQAAKLGATVKPAAPAAGQLAAS